MGNVSKKYFNWIVLDNATKRLNLMFTKVVELEDLYFVAENNSPIHALAFVYTWKLQLLQ